MNRFTNQERADMHLAYGAADESGRRASQVYEDRYPNRRMPLMKYLHAWIAICATVAHCAATCRILGEDDCRELSTLQKKSYCPSKIIRIPVHELFLSSLAFLSHQCVGYYTINVCILTICKVCSYCNPTTI